MSRIHPFSSALVATLAFASIHCSSGGGGGNSPTAPPRTITITISENQFSPQSAVIQPGDTVRWVFEGSDPTHTTTAMDATWDSETIFISAGDSFQRTFPASENGQTFEYFCTSHQACCAMQGSIRVGSQAPPPRDGY